MVIPTPTTEETSQQQLTTETLHNRLITKEGGGPKAAGKGSLAKCALKFRELSHAATAAMTANAAATTAAGNADDAESTKAKAKEDAEAAAEHLKTTAESLKRELQVHLLETRKLALASRSVRAELQEYDTAQRHVAQLINSYKIKIETLKTQLTQQQRIRRDQEEYEALAALARQVPSQRATKRKLAEVEERLEEARKEQRRVERVLEGRKKQFGALLQCVFDLKENLREGEEEEEERVKRRAEIEREEEEEEEEGSEGGGKG